MPPLVSGSDDELVDMERHRAVGGVVGEADVEAVAHIDVQHQRLWVQAAAR